MKVHRLVLLGGLLLMMAASSGCSRWVHQLQARDHLNKGVGAFRNAQFQTAIEHFKQSVALDPDFLNARRYLATAYSQLYIPGGESKENVEVGELAIKTFEDVVKIDDNHTDATATALASIGLIYFEMHKFDEAKKYQEQRMKLDPNNSEPYYWIGVIDWTQTFSKRMGLRKELNLQNPKDPTKPDILPPLPARDRDDLAKDNGPLVDEGLNALDKALKIKETDSDAMAYYSLMLREKADLEADKDAQKADLAKADEWVQKAIGLKKAAAANASSAAR